MHSVTFLNIFWKTDLELSVVLDVLCCPLVSISDCFYSSDEFRWLQRQLLHPAPRGGWHRCKTAAALSEMIDTFQRHIYWWACLCGCVRPSWADCVSRTKQWGCRRRNCSSYTERRYSCVLCACVLLSLQICSNKYLCVVWQHTLETALLSASQELSEQSDSNAAATQSLVQQRDVLQNGLLSTCRELSRVSTVSMHTLTHHHPTRRNIYPWKSSHSFMEYLITYWTKSQLNDLLLNICWVSHSGTTAILLMENKNQLLLFWLKSRSLLALLWYMLVRLLISFYSSFDFLDKHQNIQTQIYISLLQ